MALHSVVLLLLAFLCMVSVSTCSSSTIFYVGGDDGWVVNASEPYDQWAKRNTFRIGDKLVFKYREGKDSVCEVEESKYWKCDRRGPLKRMTSGVSVVPLDEPRSYYFISGKQDHCKKGQKFMLTVMAEGGHAPVPSPAPSSPPVAPAPMKNHSGSAYAMPVMVFVAVPALVMAILLG